MRGAPGEDAAPRRIWLMCPRRMKRAAAATGGRRSSPGLRWAAIVLAGASLPLAIARAAGDPVRVVVVATGAGDPVAARLIDELIAGGVTVVHTAAPDAAPIILEGEISETLNLFGKVVWLGQSVPFRGKV